VAYSEELDAKIGLVLQNQQTTRKKMFGGTCYLVNGNMLCGVYKSSIILRLGQAEAEAALHQPHVRVFDITGKPMKGWVMIEEAHLSQEDLARWIEKAKRYVEGLPPK
jgi:TfoX/Sxy family transcriptional regulator of competence genes